MRVVLLGLGSRRLLKLSGILSISNASLFVKSMCYSSYTILAFNSLSRLCASIFGSSLSSNNSLKGNLKLL